MKRKRKTSDRSFPVQNAAKRPERHNRHTCFRIKNIPDEADLEDLSGKFRELLQLQSSNVHFHSLAADIEGQTATVSFDEIPTVLKENVDKLGTSGMIFPYRNTASAKLCSLKLDTHFQGFTPLSPRKIETHKLTCIFLHGWGGHAIGSFQSPLDSHVWPRDSLPSRFPDMQVWTYGYGSKLTDTRTVGDSYSSAEELKVHLCLLLNNSKTRDRPLPIIFVAHSLGGLMLQRAMVSMHKSCDPEDERNLRSIYAALFFGVPANGMDVTVLRNMVDGTPHQFELALLDQESGFQLRFNELEEVLKAFQCTSSEVFNFWERKKTKSLTLDCKTGKYNRDGPETMLVTPASTSYGRGSKQGLDKSQFFNRDHFDLVKFSEYDTDCEVVCAILRKLATQVDTIMKAKSLDSTGMGFSVYLGFHPSFTTKIGVFDHHRLVVPQISQYDRQACLQSLHFLGMTDRIGDISPAVNTTCMWIFKAPAYLEWTHRTQGLLWIKGKPGAGKSTLMRHITKSVALDSQSPEISVSFFFHGRGATMQKNSLGLFQSLLHQLALQIPELLDVITEEYVEKSIKLGRIGEKWTWSLADLKHVLRHHVVDLARTHVIRIFIDALDECGEQEAIALIKFFKDIEKDLSICFSCRHYPVIALEGEGCEIAVQENNSQDIAVYVDRQFQDSISATELFRYQDIRTDIVGKASGVFQWVKLVTEIVIQLARRGKDLKIIQRRIAELPPELHDLYHKLLGNVDEDDKPQTFKLLQWIYFAMRPLTLEEIRITLALDSDMVFDRLHHCKESEHYSKSVPILRANILDLSRGLVEVVERNGLQAVQFVHQSVADYLRERGLQCLHDDGSWAPQGSIAGRSHFRLSRSCIRYILAKEIHTFDFRGMVGTYKNPTSGFIQGKIHEEFPFLAYATQNWILHCRKAEDEEIQQDDLASIWQKNPPLPLDARAEICAFSYLDGMWHFILPKITKLEYLASQFNLGSVLKAIISQGSSIKADEKWGTSLLLHAADRGHEAIVRILLDEGSIELNSTESRSQTPLAVAARNGREAVVKMLLEHRDVHRDLIDSSGRTPISFAAGNGSEAVFKALMQDPDCHSIDWKDNKGRTPLSYAAEHSNNGIVKMLLVQDRVDRNSRDHTGRTPFSWAVDPGAILTGPQEMVVRTFLGQASIDKDLRDSNGRTPLSWAASGYNEKIIRLLVGQDCIEKDSRDNSGRTPLSWAAQFNTVDAVQLLLDQHCVERDSRDETGRTPLSYAAESTIEGRDRVVEMLLSRHDVDAGSKDKTGRPVFFYACRYGSKGVASLLAGRKDVDVSIALRLDNSLTHDVISNEKQKLVDHRINKKSGVTRRAPGPNRVVTLEYRSHPLWTTTN